MSQLLEPPKCANIFCDNKIIQFEIKRLYKKSNRYKFCNLCRRKSPFSGKPIEWICSYQKCNNKISFIGNNLNKKFCSTKCSSAHHCKITYRKRVNKR